MLRTGGPSSGASSFSTLWFSFKYMFWPGFRRRYENALTDALRRRQAKVQARLQAKLEEQRLLEARARDALSNSVERSVELLRVADERSAAQLRAQREASLARAQQHFNELRPLLIRERRLEMLAQAEQMLLKKKMETAGGKERGS